MKKEFDTMGQVVQVGVMTTQNDTESPTAPTPSDAELDCPAVPGYGWVKNDQSPGDTRRYLLAIDDGMAPRRVGFGWRKWKHETQISDWWATDQGLVHDSIITHYAVPIPLP